MRVVTWNAQHGVPTPVGPPDLARTLGELVAIGADVLAVQELDRGRVRSDRVDQPALLAEVLGRELVWGQALDRDGQYGLALLVRGAVRSSAVHSLGGSGEPRVLLAAEIAVDDQPWSVGVTHLSTAATTAESQLTQALGLLNDHPAPRILLGDCNLEPEAVARLASDAGYRVVDGPATHSARARGAHRRIDHVLVDGEVRIEHSTVERLPVSDHLAVVVDLHRVGPRGV